MNSLLISGFGINISVDKRCLIAQNKLDNERYEYYPHQIRCDFVIVNGHSGNITFETLRWLMKHDISVTMLNWNGNLLSVALPKKTISAKLKIKLIGMIPKYINFYLHKIITKIALWRRYTNSRMFLGEDSKARICLLAKAIAGV